LLVLRWLVVSNFHDVEGLKVSIKSAFINPVMFVRGQLHCKTPNQLAPADREISPKLDHWQ